MNKPFFAFIVALFITTATFGFTSTKFNGLVYVWPATNAAAALANDGSGTLSWTGAVDSGVPAGLLMFATGTCPTGWTEYTGAAGRSIVGLVPSGANQQQVDTALNTATPENRSHGGHTHSTSESSVTVNETAHGHTVSGGSHTHSQAGTSVVNNGDGSTSIRQAQANADSTDTTTTGMSVQSANANAGATASVTINNTSGTTAGTNAPYIVLRVCQKT